MLKERLFHLERELCRAITEESTNEVRSLHSEIYKLKAEYPEVYTFTGGANAGIFNFISNSKISSEFLTELRKHVHLGNIQTDIDLQIEFCRQFVENLLEVDLKNVKFIRSDSSMSYSEAYTVPCAETEHLIVFPKKGTGSEIVDLLVHELGHTAELALRRNCSDDKLLNQFGVFSETVAHYCQYKYLSLHGSFEEKCAAIGSFTLMHLGLMAVKASIDHNVNPVNVDKILSSNHFNNYRLVYGDDQLKLMLSGFEEMPVNEMYYLHVELRFGALLALKLLDRGDIINKICTSIPNKTVVEILEELGLNIQEILDFSETEKLLRNFIYSAD